MATNWKDIGSSIIKLEGYGLYVTYIDSEIYVCEMTPHSGLPKLDPDKCIEWEKLEDPPNQKFLNLVNTRFETSLTMNNFDKIMNIGDIKEHIKQQKEAKTDQKKWFKQALWLVKNLRERDK